MFGTGDLRVVHVITSLGRGGAEQMLCKLLRAMAGKPMINDVVALGGDMDMADEIRALGVRVIDLGMAATLDGLQAARKLRRILSDRRPHIVQSWLYHADLMATLAHMTSRTPARLVWNLRCSDMELARYATRTRMIVQCLRMLSRRPDLVLANSRAALDAHLARGYRPRATAIIPNGFDVAAYRPDASARSRLRSMLDLPQQALIVGTVARVDAMKDYDNLLAASERLTTPDVHYVFIGKDTDALVAKQRRAFRTRMFGLGTRQDIAALMPGFDLLCLPSAFGEGFPNVLGEAMACGIACVATDVGGSADVIGAAGRVVPRSDPDALAAALDELLQRPQLRVSLGALGRRRVEQEFDIRQIAARYIDTYRTLAQPARDQVNDGKPSLGTR